MMDTRGVCACVCVCACVSFSDCILPPYVTDAEAILASCMSISQRFTKLMGGSFSTKKPVEYIYQPSASIVLILRIPPCTC